MLRARTVDQYGNEAGTFTADTSPTDVQAGQMIDAAYDLVRLRVGLISDSSPDLQSQAKSVVMLLAARLIETVYYPEQAANDQSAASIYGEMYEDAIRSLEMAVRDDRATTTTGFLASVPIKGIAATSEPVLPLNFEQRDMDDPDPWP